MLFNRIGLLMVTICVAGFLNVFVLLTTEFDHQSIQVPPKTALDGFSASGKSIKANDSDRITTKDSNETVEAETRAEKDYSARLSCEKYGGPSDEIASEMVYWSDIAGDLNFSSPFKSYGPNPKYLTFELDEGGWNNIRMSMETVVSMAFAMGRTLVMPPSQVIYLLNNKQKQQKNSFGFSDFFPFDEIESSGLIDIISTEEFLKREIMSGRIKSKWGDYSFPPQNRTNWNGVGRFHARPLELWMRNAIAQAPVWDYNKCIAVIPKEPGPVRVARFRKMLHEIQRGKGALATRPRINGFENNPTPVDAPAIERMREQISTRSELCVYNEQLQEAPVVHFMGDIASGARLLVHFYVFLFFEEWQQDTRVKRFVRDRLHYVDEIQCAAARVVNGVREKSKNHGTNGTFDALHIRRGDFQYKETRLEAPEIYEKIKDVIQEGSTVFVATDERNRTFFEPLGRHYNLYFLSDFKDVLEGVNTNFFGMVDQLVASRGRTFAGTFFSTFSGYINRLRGYHAQKNKSEGYQEGRIRSYYIFPNDGKASMTNYLPLHPFYWAREFPVGWRDIDRGVEE